jgi:hypothetical protein
MFDVCKQQQKPIVIIRAATSNELSIYEKHKLASIEENAQENKIEVIKLNNEVLPVDPLNKEVHIVLGDLAHKQKVTENELDPEELFIIECELKES